MSERPRERFLGPVQRADVKGDPAMRCAVGEELADQILRRFPVMVVVRNPLVG